ncbi:hypothetical protein [Burkholderia sp. Se-20378]|uniref:hypothetical protein n=1 Tax=Burkholderia sp. Se-20378 TaxID=2703899 RepID=UPI001980AED9|nr:hypothetical protein [Burkholderia sp. Se-20378]MBN3775720.1 hypothetical protein [Burkholderia sp. Se-20378]
MDSLITAAARALAAGDALGALEDAEQAQQGGLGAAGRAEQREARAAPHREVDVVQDGMRSERFRQAVDA